MPDHGANCVDYDMKSMGSGHTCEEFAAMEGGCEQKLRGKHFQQGPGKAVTIGDFCPVSCKLCDSDNGK
jgi:hypothetical protein